MSKGLKIIELRAENVKKLKAIEIRPDGNTIVISGRNEQGKSSVMDSIWYALGGREAAKGLKKPIREGEETAFVKLDLGDIIVKRNWTSNDQSYLSVENKDGATFKSPQTILDGLIGNLSFDPLAFSNMDGKKQREALLDLVDIKIDLDEWEKDRAEAYEERTGVNRKVKELEGQIAGIVVPEDTPDEEVNSSTVLDEIQEAQAVKDKNDGARSNRVLSIDQLAREELVIVGLINEIDDIEKKLSDKCDLLGQLQDGLKKTMKDISCQEAAIEKLVDPDMTAFREKLANVETVNQAVREKQRGVELQSSLDKVKKESGELTTEIDGMDKEKSDAIEAAEFPIEHLGFDETGVTYKGIPFGQCSAAERLRVSLCIAMAANPRLKVLRIMDGSLLDEANLKVINEMVKENDYQLWIEKIAEAPDGASVFIEDGAIKETGA